MTTTRKPRTLVNPKQRALEELEAADKRYKALQHRRLAALDEYTRLSEETTVACKLLAHAAAHPLLQSEDEPVDPTTQPPAGKQFLQSSTAVVADIDDHTDVVENPHGAIKTNPVVDAIEARIEAGPELSPENPDIEVTPPTFHTDETTGMQKEDAPQVDEPVLHPDEPAAEEPAGELERGSIFAAVQPPLVRGPNDGIPTSGKGGGFSFDRIGIK